MATQKRRVIYMPDEEWKALKQDAGDAGISVSVLVRQRMSERSGLTAAYTPKTPGQPFAQFRPAPKPSQRHG